jgi:hypothetical protein
MILLLPLAAAADLDKFLLLPLFVVLDCCSPSNPGITPLRFYRIEREYSTINDFFRRAFFLEEPNKIIMADLREHVKITTSTYVSLLTRCSA